MPVHDVHFYILLPKRGRIEASILPLYATTYVNTTFSGICLSYQTSYCILWNCSDTCETYNLFIRIVLKRCVQVMILIALNFSKLSYLYLAECVC